MEGSGPADGPRPSRPYWTSPPRRLSCWKSCRCREPRRRWTRLIRPRAMDGSFRRQWSGSLLGRTTAVRGTMDAGENHELLSPRGQLFDTAQLVASTEVEPTEGDGIRWIATPADGGAGGSTLGRSSAWKKSPRRSTCTCDWDWSRRDRYLRVMPRAERCCGSSEGLGACMGVWPIRAGEY